MESVVGCVYTVHMYIDACCFEIEANLSAMNITTACLLCQQAGFIVQITTLSIWKAFIVVVTYPLP